MKLDFVMWTYNGAKKLEKTLPRFEKVIPSEVIRKKIASDDHSTDDTVEILKQYGWEVYLNPGKKGIGYNANNAISKTETEFVGCLEQDLWLAHNWWTELSKELYKPENNDVGMFVGLRLPNIPIARNFMRYRERRAIKEGYPSTPMDNTILRMSAVRQVGGIAFLKLSGMGIDILLRRNLIANGWRYLVKTNVVSVHLRDSLKEELDHIHGYCRTNPAFDQSKELKRKLWMIFLRSPIVAVKLALNVRDPNMVWYYPLVRWMRLKGYLDARPHNFC